MRIISTEMAAIVTGPIVRSALFAALYFDGGTVRVNSSDRILTWGGYPWYGLGRFGAISRMEESHELQGAGITLSLSGIPSDMVSAVLNEPYLGRKVEIYYGVLNDVWQVVADPLQIFSGIIDQMLLSAGETATIQLTVENRLVRWEQPKVRRYTNADQQAAYPGDLGLEFLSQAVEQTFHWGTTGAALPVVVTGDRDSSSGLLRVDIVSSGQQYPDIYGVVYGTVSKPLPGNVHPNISGYTASTFHTGSFGLGTYWTYFTPNPGTNYYRAWAHNVAGYAYGDEKSFVS